MPQIPKYNLKPLNLNDEKIGKRIARLRIEKSLTQTELGEKIGISQQLVAAYENGHLRIYDEMLIRFALALKVSSDNLLGIKERSNISQPPSLRVMRRMREIDELPESRKKSILKTIDDLIRANR